MNYAFLMDLLGWTGSALLALCVLPQCLKCYKQGHARGLSHLTLWCWLLGEICICIWTWVVLDGNLILVTNYALNLIGLAVIMYYRYFPRR